MNLADLHHETDREFSSATLFNGDTGKVAAMQLRRNAQIKPHTSALPALLVCVSGEVMYEENNRKEKLGPGDYVKIQPEVLHWVHGLADAQLILLK